VMSHELIDLIGRRGMRRSCHFFPIRGSNGYAHNTHAYLVAKQIVGCLRDTDGTASSLCPQCGCLLYPAGADEWYLLRRYWPGRAVFLLLDYAALCRADVFENTLLSRDLARLAGTEVPLADEPQDGLPADYMQLLAAVKRVSRRR
jgi:hypothetical protein